MRFRFLFCSSRRWAVGLFLGLLAVLGVAFTPDYGMGWDEPAERLNALVSAKYVALRLAPELARHQPRLAAIPDLRQHRDADHGVLFLLPLVAAEARWPADPAVWARRRHLVGFLLFVAGAWAVYRLGALLLGSWRGGLAGAGLLVLSPRIFAEAFYNYKDVVFLSLFALAMLTLLRLLRRPTAGRALWHAVATAAAIDVRAMGVLLPVLTLSFAALEMTYRPVRRRGFAGALGLYVPVLAGLVVLGWPYLWDNPVRYLGAALGSFGHYAKAMDVFYLGRFVAVRALPWHYVPVWLLITTPVPCVVLFGLGLLELLRAGWAAGPAGWLRRSNSRRYLLVLAWLGGPVVGVIGLHSVVYDGWRHLYFIYPAFVLVAGLGLRRLWQAWRRGRWAGAPLAMRARGLLLLALALGMARVAWRMGAEHPFQYVYFSFLPGRVIEQNFERDYWGLSVKQGLEWVLAHDARRTVPVSMDARTEMTLRINAKMLPPAARARLRLVPADSAAGGYFLSIYRWHPGAYPARTGRPVHTIRVGGAAILGVWRRP